MSRHPKDKELELLTYPTTHELRVEIIRLRNAIRSHRDQRGDDRCWLDDEKLYAALPEGIPAKTHLDQELMLKNCARFIGTRQHPGDRFNWGDVQGGGMLAILEQAERELPALLLNPDDWRGTYSFIGEPVIEWLWMPYGEGKLHIQFVSAYPANLFMKGHGHAWPLAARIIKGWCATAFGHGLPGGPPPTMGPIRIMGTPPDEDFRRADARKQVLEIVDPNAWHFSRPLEGGIIQVMVSGRPWRSNPHKPDRDFRRLNQGRKNYLVTVAQSLYPLEKQALIACPVSGGSCGSGGLVGC